MAFIVQKQKLKRTQNQAILREKYSTRKVLEGNSILSKDKASLLVEPLREEKSVLLREDNSIFIYSSESLISRADALPLSKFQKIKLLHLFSTIYFFQHVFLRGEKERVTEGARISAITMQDRYGSRDYNLLRDTLETLGFIESDHQFSKKKKQAKRYRIVKTDIIPALVECRGHLREKLKGGEYTSDTTPPVWLSTPDLVATFNSRRDFLLSVQSRLSLKSDWRDLLAAAPLLRLLGIHASAQDLIRGHYYASTAESGRWFHFLTSCRRELRQKIVIDGEPTTELDIKAAQPSIIASFYPGPCEEKDKYLGVIQSGKFYEYIAALVGEDIGGETRDAFKKECLKQVFYDQNGDNIPSYKILAAFKTEFPELSEILMKFKQTAGDKLAMHMQKLEAKIIIGGVIDYAIQYAIPVLPVHDSLFFRTRDLPLMQGLLNSSFKNSVGFIPRTEPKNSHNLENA